MSASESCDWTDKVLDELKLWSWSELYHVMPEIGLTENKIILYVLLHFSQ